MYQCTFGMLMPGRKFSSGSYRYGFNGKENDNDVKGEGNQQDYGMRIYDPRLGKFLSVDPLQPKYPFYSPYHFSSNSPIASIDIDGLESNKNFNYADVWYQNFAEGLINGLTGEDVNHPISQQMGYGTIDPGGAIKRNPLYQESVHAYQMYLVVTGQMEPEETEYYKATEAFLRDMASRPGAGEGYTTGVLLQAAFIIVGAEAEFKANVKVMGGSREALTEAWNNDIRSFKSLDEVIVKNTTSKPSVAASGGNMVSAESNATANRPTWQQSEADIVTSDYSPQQSFKNGKLVRPLFKGSVRPEGYKPGQTIEAKNYNLTTEKGIKNMIKNVVTQVKARQSNLPKNTTQNITLDIRGQSLTTKQMQSIKSRLMSQTGSKNININYKTD